MEITIQYTGQLAGIAGTSEETVTVAGDGRLKSLVDELAERHGRKYADLVLDGEGRLHPSLLVIVDGEQIDGDRAALDLEGVRTVMLMTPIAGG